jgi:hypothetical protein
MSKTINLGCLALLVLATASASDEFKRFHAVEAYEVQPGILMVPTYSSNGAVCKIVLEKRHYSSNEIDLDAEMSHQQIWQAFDQLVPKKDRGPSSLDLGDTGELTTTAGVSTTTIADYENVSLEMDGKTKETGDREYVVAVIRWKRRNCN